MKIVVELDDFWMEGDSDLSSELNSYVKDKVVYEIWGKIKDKVHADITSVLKEKIDSQISEKTEQCIDNILKSDQIKSPSINVGKEGKCTLREYIEYKFLSSSGWGSPDKSIEKLAQIFSHDMKSRYDMMFASQVVIKMSEQGLLKDGVLESLLPKNN